MATARDANIQVVQEVMVENPAKVAILVCLGQPMATIDDAVNQPSGRLIRDLGAVLKEGNLSIGKAFAPGTNRGMETTSAMIRGNQNGSPISVGTNANLNSTATAQDLSRCIRTRMMSAETPTMFVGDADLLNEAILDLLDQPPSIEPSQHDKYRLCLLVFDEDDEVTKRVYLF